MSLLFGKDCLVLNEDNCNGFAPLQIGIRFDFNDTISILITEEMFKRIQSTFEHVEKTTKK